MNNIDVKYFEAIKNNDTDALEKMVAEYANYKGYKIKAYHGSRADFNKFSYEFIGKIGSSEGYGFYFTNNKEIAQMYAEKEGKLYSAYLQINKSLNSLKKTITKSQLAKFIQALDPRGDEILSNWGDVQSDGYRKVLIEAVNSYYDNNKNDVELISVIINDNGRNYEEVYAVLKKTLGYDGIITVPDWGHGQTIYVVFSSNQIKVADVIVKDDNGKIIPISQRFNIGSQDIRETKIKTFKQFILENNNQNNNIINIVVDLYNKNNHKELLPATRNYLDNEFSQLFKIDNLVTSRPFIDLLAKLSKNIYNIRYAENDNDKHLLETLSKIIKDNGLHNLENFFVYLVKKWRGK